MAYEYEDKLVIFIDILGFKENIQKSVTDTKLYKKIKTTMTHIFNEKKENDKHFNAEYIDAFYQMSIFSDSIIYSAPLKNDNTVYYALVMAEYMQREILDFGFLTRGGISIGKMYHDKEIAFGPALIEAVEIEQKVALYPRVVFDQKTFDEIDKRLKQNGIYAYQEDKKSFEVLLNSYNNEIGEQFYYLDFLSQDGEFDEPIDYVVFLNKVKRFVEENLNKLNIEKHVQSKYKWLKKELLRICEEKKLDYDNLYNDCSF